MENSFLHESHLLQEKETLSEQKRCFFQEKANFEKERKHFTEAAIRLGREVNIVNKSSEISFMRFSVTILGLKFQYLYFEQ